MIGMRTIRPLVSVRPETDLTLQTVRSCLFRDELQSLEVLISFGIGQRRRAHFVTGYVEQIRIGKVKVIARHVTREVITDPKVKAEAVDSTVGKLREVRSPE